mgnify:CR=1 FL=1
MALDRNFPLLFQTETGVTVSSWVHVSRLRPLSSTSTTTLYYTTGVQHVAPAQPKGCPRSSSPRSTSKPTVKAGRSPSRTSRPTKSSASASSWRRTPEPTAAHAGAHPLVVFRDGGVGIRVVHHRLRFPHHGVRWHDLQLLGRRHARIFFFLTGNILKHHSKRIRRARY